MFTKKAFQVLDKWRETDKVGQQLTYFEDEATSATDVASSSSQRSENIVNMLCKQIAETCRICQHSFLKVALAWSARGKVGHYCRECADLADDWGKLVAGPPEDVSNYLHVRGDTRQALKDRLLR